MTTDQIVAHWQKRARDPLTVARLANGADDPADAIFHCHLAIERALKAEVMRTTGKQHPKSHDLLVLARLVPAEWGEEDESTFDALTDFAVAARYDDPAWEERYATRSEAARWIARTERFLSRILP